MARLAASVVLVGSAFALVVACSSEDSGSSPPGGGASSGSTTDGGGAGADGAAPSDGGTAVCEPGLSACGASCVDTKTDPKNCGTCGNACAKLCADGACVTECPNGTTECSGGCFDTTSSAAHCGACGAKCAAGKVCVASACSCGTTVATFTSIQTTILTPSCAGQQCHGGNQPKAGLDLTAGNAHAELVGSTSACSGKALVAPGSVDQSYLMNKLTGVGICSGGKMPKADEALQAAQLDAIRSWICDGAKND